MGDHFKGEMELPFGTALPPSYEESHKHDKIEDLSVPGRTIFYQQAQQTPRFAHQPTPQQYLYQLPQGGQQAFYAAQQSPLQMNPYAQQQVFVPQAQQTPRFAHQPSPQQYLYQLPQGQQAFYAAQQSPLQMNPYAQQQVYVSDAFADPSARFTRTSPPSIPPPPPGVAHNAAQLAAAAAAQQGAQVVASKQKSPFW